MGTAKFQEAGAAALASLAAGPTLLTSASLIDAYLRLPAPIEIHAPEILYFILGMLPVAVIGALIAFPPNMLGTLVMAQWARRSWLARTPAAWILAGGAFGGALGQALIPDDTWGLTASFVVTGGFCAAVCRLFVDLGDEEAA